MPQVQHATPTCNYQNYYDLGDFLPSNQVGQDKKNMAATYVKLSDIPSYISLNFWRKHLSLRQKQMAKLLQREQYVNKIWQMYGAVIIVRPSSSRLIAHDKNPRRNMAARAIGAVRNVFIFSESCELVAASTSTCLNIM